MILVNSLDLEKHLDLVQSLQDTLLDNDGKKDEKDKDERAIEERKSALMVNEDESISEFINQSAIQSVQKEVALLEKKLMEVTADKNTMG